MNIGSICSVRTYPNFAAYTAAKFGLLGLSRCIYEEVREKGIRVNTICPAAANTEWMKVAGMGASPWKLDDLLQPQDVAELVFACVTLPPRVRWKTSSHGPPVRQRHDDTRMRRLCCGGRFGGFGAALAAARAGARWWPLRRTKSSAARLLWPGFTCGNRCRAPNGFPDELWQRMSAMPGATCGSNYAEAVPGSLLVTDEGRAGRALAFEPWAYDWCARETLRETGNCTLLLGHALQGVEVRTGRIAEILREHSAWGTTRSCGPASTWMQRATEPYARQRAVPGGGEEPQSLYGELRRPRAQTCA